MKEWNIPNKKVKFENGEAPWINKNIKAALSKRYSLTKRYYVNDQVQSDYNLLLNHSKKCRGMILCAKNEHTMRMSKNLNDPSTAAKSYWSILNWLLNNKKILSIPPIFHNGKVISDFKDKVTLIHFFLPNVHLYLRW